MEKEVKIVPPDGYEIDKENSTLECIKFREVKNDKNPFRKNIDQNTLNGLNNHLVKVFDCDVMYVTSSSTPQRRPDLYQRSFVVYDDYKVNLIDHDDKTIIEITRK